MTYHESEIEKDELGWIEVSCSCGWFEGPFLGVEDAMDSFGDHRALSA